VIAAASVIIDCHAPHINREQSPRPTAHGAYTHTRTVSCVYRMLYGVRGMIVRDAPLLISSFFWTAPQAVLQGERQKCSKNTSTARDQRAKFPRPTGGTWYLLAYLGV
jgi:hypothetical protein